MENRREARANTVKASRGCKSLVEAGAEGISEEEHNDYEEWRWFTGGEPQKEMAERAWGGVDFRPSIQVSGPWSLWKLVNCACPVVCLSHTLTSDVIHYVHRDEQGCTVSSESGMLVRHMSMTSFLWLSLRP